MNSVEDLQEGMYPQCSSMGEGGTLLPWSSHQCLEPLRHPAELPMVMDLVGIDLALFPELTTQHRDDLQLAKLHNNPCFPQS